ncbi:MAG: electron transport complex subunit RsxC [candidate division WOR-3 bacterium]|nr:MAG: electron transport complex subunit RsxC [candidate division WOR-3 bacterium]
MLSGFTGGVHPPESKNTEDSTIEVMPVPKKVYIPFSQHTGKPATPLVKKGDDVKIGTKIGEADGFISASVHASISGKVIDIIDHAHPVIGSASCCIIEGNDSEDWVIDVNAERNTDDLTEAQLLHSIKEAGIVGLGGAAFPSHVKLSPPKDKKIDTLIINGCECEPVLTADHRLMLEHAATIIEGARVFQKILHASTLIFAVEDNKKNAIELFRDEDVRVAALKTKYPQGAEKQLIKAILKREVPRGGLPMDVGCVVHNVGTCHAALMAIKYGKPLIDRVLTVAGDGVREKKNVLVRIGTPVNSVIDFCGGYVDKPERVILGGPMMGIAQYADDVPVVKGTSGILVWPAEKAIEEGPCVRCAACVDSCPMGLMPTEICSFVKNKNFDMAKTYGLLDCIECGCCAYMCPAAIPLVHYFKYGKSEIWRRSKT